MSRPATCFRCPTLALALLSACATLPRTGDPQQLVLPPIVSVRSERAATLAQGFSGSQPAVFVDSGGVIHGTEPIPRTPEDLEGLLMPESIEAMVRLSRGSSAKIIIVTNQGGIDLGEVTDAQVRALLGRLARKVLERGGRVDAIYYCPASAQTMADVPEGQVSGRKPAPGMLLRAARDFGPMIDLADSVLVSDGTIDFLAAKAASEKMLTVGVKTGSGSTNPKDPNAPRPDLLYPDFAAFTDWYLLTLAQRAR